ncbi:MAG: hypothetical protein MUO26_01370 [Methanotrichaceae archaeon]|nr:hypothetical protein [Methanotrichaceae archaeon]
MFSLVFVTVLTFYCGRLIYDKNNRKLYLVLALLGCLGQLSFFKYSGFLALQGVSIFTFLALGLSYFTFMALSYVFDIYRGKLRPTNSLIEYALFVSFFPVITSGPILRAVDFLNQIKSRIVITSKDLQLGLTLITIGLILKLLIADNLAPFVDAIFSDPTKFGSQAIILGTLAFGIQLYFDFAGYSDIAIGTAMILGFKFSMNFNNPYFAMNPSDFWRRWNISLSTFLRDYLYIPLGGNRKGTLRTYLNLIVTMVLCGLWHGATWNFLIWGGYHGCLLCLHRLLPIPNRRIFLIIIMLLTQYFVFLGWLIFRVNNLDNLIYCLRMFLVPTGLNFFYFIIGLLAVSIFILSRDKIANNDWVCFIGSMKPIYWFIYMVIAINVIYWSWPVRVTKFIYAGF